ncbi:hypothetical protein Poli38472_013467 [Pythium oligandrum]|uniref:Cyclin N-terminal domain-containing protein n=1 Tax=Pythium oligandrum TaxID=41045 RepID=A0A8K1C7T6_PYTOL|nr:hypothetical protein Poli38472_013467 [Pythium oligandrum]|eukprot:TMW57993.1 hypothetical protein Poli38472_013467 [Pythium oligandrum]
MADSASPHDVASAARPSIDVDNDARPSLDTSIPEIPVENAYVEHLSEPILSTSTPSAAHQLTRSHSSSLPAPLTPIRSAPNKQVLFIKTNDSPTSHHSERTRHLHARKVTRDIAALDFLQNIPMRSEALHEAHARPHGSPKRHTDAAHAQGETSDPARDGEDSSSSDMGYMSNEALAGRRLPGFEAEVIEMPSLFRYRFTTKYPAASAVVRRWEGQTAQQGMLESRMFMSRGCGYPLAALTVLKYNGNETSSHRKRFMSVSNTEPMDYDWRGKSYYRLLHASYAPCDKDRDSQDDHPNAPAYLPNYLDDPEFRQGRHRHVVRGDKNIGPVVSSILLFVKPNELKAELNKKFQEKHTWLDSDLSLSKIRNLKRETLTTCQRLDLEVATAALACVYFEKLVLSHYVNKSNRKLYMSVCLLLAAKFNEPHASDALRLMIKKILAEIDQVHSLPSRDVLTTEFKVYAQLSFNLHVPLAEIHPHFTRLLKLIESNPRKYLDEDVFTTYSQLMLDEKTASDATARQRLLAGETPDEGTDGEVLLSDEEEIDEEEEVMVEEGGPTAGGADSRRERTAMAMAARLPWHRVHSFTQWWSDRRLSQPPTPTGTDKAEAEAPTEL